MRSLLGSRCGGTGYARLIDLGGSPRIDSAFQSNAVDRHIRGEDEGGGYGRRVSASLINEAGIADTVMHASRQQLYTMPLVEGIPPYGVASRNRTRSYVLAGLFERC